MKEEPEITAAAGSDPAAIGTFVDEVLATARRRAEVLRRMRAALEADDIDTVVSCAEQLCGATRKR